MTFKEPHYTFHSTGRVYPPRTTKQLDGYNYYMEVTFKASGEAFLYNDALALFFDLPDETKQTVILNKEKLFFESDDIFYTYEIMITSRAIGWANITLAEWDLENNKVFDNRLVNFIGSSVYLY